MKLIENEQTEFKSILNDKLERVAVSFLNSKTGGDLYIGIDDRGKIIGVDDADKIQLSISDRLKNNISPSCLGLFDIHIEEIDQNIVVHVVFSSGTEKPYYINAYGMTPKGCFLRIGSGVQKMEQQMIDKFFATRTRNSLRNIVSPRYTTHSFAQLKIYYEEHGFQYGDLFLQNLDLYTPDGKLNYIAYLLADVNSISIKVAKYAGTDKSDLVENEEYGYCSLIKATERVLDKLEIENKTFTKITGYAKRSERRMINKTALREAFINAIVHNDYSSEVTPVVEIYSNRLTITSYGGLISGLSVEEFFNGRSMPRNRELMRIFRDLEFVEQLGSGMSRILKEYGRNIFHLSENFIEVAFPFATEFLNASNESFGNKISNYSYTKHATEQVTDQVTDQVNEQVNEQVTDQVTEQVTDQVNDQVTDQVKRLLTVFNKSDLSVKEIATSLGMKHRATLMYSYIKPAINLKYIEMTDPESPNSPKQKYRLTIKGIHKKIQLEYAGITKKKLEENISTK